MRRLLLVLLAGALLAWNAAAQAPANSQTSAAAQSRTSVSGGKSGAQVQSDTSLAASQETKASRGQSGKKGSGTQVSGSGSASSSTSASAQAGPHSATLSSGTTFEAVLSGSLDARKNKEGDQVVARTTQAVKSNGEVVIPKGSKLIGHVTQAKARAKGDSQSTLGIVFDRAIPKHGEEMPIHVVIQALAAAQTAASISPEESGAMGSAGGMGSVAGSGRASGSGGGLVGAAGSTVSTAAGAVTNTAGAAGRTATGAVGATANTAASATGAATGTQAVGRLTSSSTGAIGLKGLSLNSEASNATQGSLIVSSTRNVHLDSGTQMLLRAQGGAQSQGQSQGHSQTKAPSSKQNQKP